MEKPSLSPLISGMADNRVLAFRLHVAWCMIYEAKYYKQRRYRGATFDRARNTSWPSITGIDPSSEGI